MASRIPGWALVRARENGRWIRTISHADARKETESTTMAVSRWNTAVTRPPRAAPTASMVPHSEPDSAFAVARSSAATRFGTAASEAGSNAALKVAMIASSG